MASLWELIVKARKGRIPITNPILWWDRAIAELAISELPIRGKHVRALDSLPGVHADPFDRMLIAQALADALTLVSRDEHFASYPVKVLW